MQRVWLRGSLLLTIVLIVSICASWRHKEDSLKPQRFFDGQMLTLAEAISEGDTVKIGKLIRSGADPNYIGKEGVTPLVYAYGVGQKTAMVALLENGADPNKTITSLDAAPTIRNRSAVTIIAGTPDNGFLEILLDHGGNINAKDSDGEPILISMVNVRPPNYEGMEMLVKRGADLEASDSGGYTLLMNLANLGDFEHVYYLLQHQADFRKKSPLGLDISTDVFGYEINEDKFPEAYKWQRKCQEFLLAHGMRDPGRIKPREKTPEEQAEWQRIYNNALETDKRRHGY